MPKADAKKKGYTLPKQLKLLIKGKETQDLISTIQGPASHSTKTKDFNKIAALGKPVEILLPKLRTNPVFKADPSDIIDVALHARKEKKSELTEAEAKKSKITVPKPLKLAFKGNDFMVDIKSKVNEPAAATDKKITQ